MGNPKSLVLSLTAPQRHGSLGDDVEKVPQPRESRAGRVEKWKRMLYMGSMTSATVLVLNLVMVLWASLRHSEHGQGILRVDNCDRIKQLSTGIHFLINFLSTLLLATSNFAMQCLAAPTRKDVDRAHARSKWLDIGVPSVRNLWQIPRLRMLLWLCLALSSVPLHLFYNSTVYSSLSVNIPHIFVSNSSFPSLTADEITTTYDAQLRKAKGADAPLPWFLNLQAALRLLRISGSLERLPPEECISAYATDFISKYNNLILVSPEFNGSVVPIEYLTAQIPPSPIQYTDVAYYWICKDDANWYEPSYCTDSKLSEIRAQDDWVVEGYKVDYCLAEKTQDKCQLEYNMPLAIVVIIANLAKAILICLVVFLLEDNPLLTVGDAVAFFLRSPDDAQDINCLFERPMLSGIRGRPVPVDKPQAYIAKPKRRWSSLSRARWASFLSIYILSLAVSLAFIVLGLTKMKYSENIWSSGLGAIQSNTMVSNNDWPGELIPNVLMANIPQLIYSLLYVLSNGILTSMALADEWNSFSRRSKGLRVSASPRGHQQSSRFLSLPYRYGIPFIFFSAFLHWLISQSIFLVRANAYDDKNMRASDHDVMTLGYSPLAIVITICVAVLMPIAFCFMGCRRFKSGMPVAGSCSLAISAACHPRAKTDDANGKLYGIEYRLLQWGAEPGVPGDGEIGHCTFSDGHVTMPEDGVLYR